MTATSGQTDTGSAERLRFLDGYRGIAALSVLVFHVTGRSHWVATATPLGIDGGAWMERLGNFGVCIFFLISGLVLYRPFVEAHLRGDPAPRTGPFLQRRLARILPAYVIAISCFFALGLSSVRGISGREYAYQYLLVQNYVRRGFLVSMPVAWTLCIELTFYFSLPLIALAIRHLPRARSTRANDRLTAHLVGLSAMVLAAWAYRYFVLYGRPQFPGSPPNYFPSFLDWFALGMLLAVAHAWRAEGGRLPRWVQQLADAQWICWILAVQLYWVSVQVHIPPDFMTVPGKTLARYPLNGASALLLLLPAVLGNRPTRVLRAFDGRTLTFLGMISYGIYLWHPIVLRLSDRLDVEFNLWTRLLFALAVTITVAYASYRLVERPVMDAQRRWSRRSSRRPAHTLVPA